MLKERIEMFLKRDGLTRLEFAERIGANVFTLDNLLEKPDYETLLKIAGVFGEPIWMLFVDEEIKRHQVEYEASYGAPVFTCPHCGTRFKLIEEDEQ